MDDTITFEQHKKDGDEEALVIIPLHPDSCTALAAMPPSNVVRLTHATTFLTTSFGQPFQTAASFGNWFRERCNEADYRTASARMGFARRRPGGLPTWGAPRIRSPPSPGTLRLPKSNATQRPPTGSASRVRR